jgi:predicted nuclease of predicted toxin-antitoxin system
MKFVADESCDFAVVRALREAGHEVLAIAEAAPGTEDADVLALAAAGECVVLTEDKDFGQLVFAEIRRSSGVVLLRYPASARSALAAETVELARRLGPELLRSFVVLSPGRYRRNPGLP